jgi:F1F0 ATPase subunit 2
MNLDITTLAMGAGAGMVAGTVFFAGLWLTVRALPAARNPGLLMLASFLARTIATLGIIWVGSSGRWYGMLAALAGFVAVRLAMTRRVNAARADAGEEG